YLEQTLTFSQSTARELREAAEWCHVSEDPNVRKQRPPSLPHKSPLPSLSRTQGRCHGEEKPAAQHMHKAYAERTSSTSHRRIEPCAQHKHGGKERDGHIQVNTAVLHFSLPRRVGIASHTHSEARRTQSAPSMCTQQAAAQSPSYRRNGEQKQSPSRTIGATGRKEEVGAFQQRRQQRYSQRDK
ncbi:hypothetical protein TcCL_Unassigned00390, partial [Trypanosoma cruzi]